MGLFTSSIVVVGGTRYRICVVSRRESYVEYRPEVRSDWLSWWYSRGDVRVFKERGILMMTPIRTECSGTGDLWSYASAEPRKATLDEAAIFEHAMR